MLDDAREVAEDLLNSEGRSSRHVTAGLLVTAGFALAASALATRAVRPGRGPAITERPRGTLGLVLPAVFSATTLSALRVWNAPSTRDRSSALRLWGAAQALNALWLAARPRSLAGQIMAAMTTAGMAAAFANRARRIDERTGKLAAPMGSGTRLANRVSDQIEDRPTLH